MRCNSRNHSWFYIYYNIILLHGCTRYTQPYICKEHYRIISSDGIYFFCQKATHAQVPMYQIIDRTLCTEKTGAIVAYKDDMNVDKQSTV